jgi:hypothetical protein
LRITTDGHLILEGKGVYINDPNGWTVVWSNQPFGFDYPVGVYGSTGYKLYVQADGEFELLDGASVRIWSSKYSKNRLGYKYPVESIYPSIKPTEGPEPGQIDIYNSLPGPNIKWMGDNLTIPWVPTGNVTTCTYSIILSGQGLASPNGRYKLYVDASGNLIMKDGYRSMWQSKTADFLVRETAVSIAAHRVRIPSIERR